MGDIAQRGNRLTFAKGGKVNTRRENRLEELGRVDAEKAYSRKGKRNLREEKHRIRSELKKGGKPWGTGPKPGTHEFLEHHLHKPRKGKAAGSIVKKVVQGGKKIIDKIKKKKRHESLDIPGSPGPHIGKYPGIDKAMKNIKKSGDIWGPGKAAGGRIGRAAGGPAVKRAAEKAFEHFGGGEKGKPHSSKEGRIAAGKQNIKRMMARRKQWKTPDWGKKPDRKFKKYSDLLQRYPKMPQPHKAPGDTPHIPLPKHDPKKPKKYQPAATGGRIGFKKGGSDKNWIQKAVNPKHKGYCTPMTKKTCTPARKALARTFKKKAKTGW